MRRSESSDSLVETVRNWRKKRIVVLGDMIVDEFIFGRTDRVSREAPVVIVRYDSSRYSPGGAANAVQNVAALGGRAVPVGFVGGDVGGERLREIFRDLGIPVGGLITVGSRFTTTKMRVMAGDYHAQLQQIVRVDKEQEKPFGVRAEDRILAAFKRELPRASAAILSDYNQGIFTPRMIREAVSLCRARSVPVVADSRFQLPRFKGITTATPNEVEAAGAAGVDVAGGGIELVGRRLLKRLSASSILVTRGRFGMSLFEPRRRIRSVPVIGSPEATDVTGAGDTVAAAVALTLAAGGSMFAAMRIANAAASIVVMKRGTAVADAREVVALVREYEGPE